LVSADWVAERLGSPGYVFIDTRPAMRYLMGHLKGAVSVPQRKMRDMDNEGRLLPAEALSGVFSAAGLGDGDRPVLYDGYDGLNAALAAWALEYLGRDDAHVMDLAFEGWKAQGREVLYRPVTPETRHFAPRVNAGVRATLADVSGGEGLKLIDARSAEEYRGEAGGDRPGHIPGAVHVAWDSLAGDDGSLTCSPERAQEVLDAANVGPNDRIVTYCQTGTRAAVVYSSLKRLGYDVRLYDASYAEWHRSGLPVEK
jgi:thiosulfate/3-mercaptopyruvate sulfurtransferase